MNNKLKNDVLRLIGEYQSGLLDCQSPDNISSLRKCVLNTELDQEIDALYAMLLDLNSFEESFKQRCLWRMGKTEHSVPFSSMPDSPSNRLYWNIAQMVFQPQTLGAMFEIILPTIENVIEISLELHKPANETKIRLTDMQVRLMLSPISGKLLNAPEMSELNHFVLCGDKLFDVHDLIMFPFPLHIKCHRELKRNYPTVFNRLYRHNEFFRNLAADVSLFNHNGTTLRKALRLLSQGFIQGGSNNTGGEYATRQSEIAIRRFFEYFNSLPITTQNTMRALSWGNRTLGSIIDTELDKGQCVETSSKIIDAFLDDNSEDPLLDMPSNMTLEELNVLEQKYNVTGDNQEPMAIKNSLMYFRFPPELKRQAISGMAPPKFDTLIDILFNFPPSYYEDLRGHIAQNNPREELAQLARYIRGTIFNREQKKALAKVLIKNFTSYHLKSSSLLWAIRTRDPIFLKEAIKFHPPEMRLSIINQAGSKQGSVLHLLKNNYKLQHIILKYLPKPERVEVFKLKDQAGDTFLKAALPHPVQLQKLLNKVPKDSRLEAIKAGTNKQGETLLHCALQFTESLEYLLGLYPKHQRYQALSLKNKQGNNPLCNLSSNQIKSVLALLPECHRLPFLNISNNKISSHLTVLIANKTEILDSDPGFSDSFLPEMLGIFKILRKKRNDHVPIVDKINAMLLACSSVEAMKRNLLHFFAKFAKTAFVQELLELLEPDCPADQRFDRIKLRWYRSAILNYLEGQIAVLPPKSRLANRFNEIMSQIIEVELSLDELKNRVTDIKQVADTHQDTGAKGFFKCTWARHTANYNQLAKLFDFNQDNEFIMAY